MSEALLSCRRLALNVLCDLLVRMYFLKIGANKDLFFECFIYEESFLIEQE